MTKPNNELQRFSAAYPELKGSLFVVTYGRSGSTLLQNLLLTIPGCTLRGENYNAITPLYEACQRVRRTKARWQKAGGEPSHPWYGADSVAPNRFNAALVDAFVKHVIVPPRDTRWLGFKEIRYNTMGERFFDVLNFMRNNFPNAHIIMNTRNKEQVLKSGWWPKHDPDNVRAMITRMDEVFAEYHHRNPSCTSLIDYADFSHDPAAMKPVFDAMDEPYDEAALRAVIARKLSH